MLLKRWIVTVDGSRRLTVNEGGNACNTIRVWKDLFHERITIIL
jgi:hypothetical protein